MVRRSSGGGAILHDRELTYSIVLPQSHPLARRAELLYQAMHATLIETLAELGIVATLCDGSAADSTARHDRTISLLPAPPARRPARRPPQSGRQRPAPSSRRSASAWQRDPGSLQFRARAARACRPGRPRNQHRPPARSLAKSPRKARRVGSADRPCLRKICVPKRPKSPAANSPPPNGRSAASCPLQRRSAPRFLPLAQPVGRPPRARGNG